MLMLLLLLLKSGSFCPVLHTQVLLLTVNDDADEIIFVTAKQQ
jgi:hypothetical protein